MLSKLILVLVMASWVAGAQAQNFEVTKCEEDLFDLSARTNPVKDMNGKACAVLKVMVPDRDFEIEGNMGTVKIVRKTGEIDVYVPEGTKKIAIRHKTQGVIRAYEISIPVQQMSAYEVTVRFKDLSLLQKEEKHPVYAGVGFSLLTVMGPSVHVGYQVKQHHIEVGAVYGLDKTEDIFLYTTGSTVKAAYSYKAFQIRASYGYSLPVVANLDLMPLAGVAFNGMYGSDVDGQKNGSDDFMRNASSLSAFVGARLSVSLGHQLKLHVTPEYAFGFYKDDNLKKLSDIDDHFDKWTDGFNLNIGFSYYF